MTIGNIVGGVGFVGLVYWYIYLRPQKVVEVKEKVPVSILVVDDDPDFIEITRTILGGKGYQVATAASGEQAMQSMKEKRPDLVLLDVMMSTPLEGVGVARRMAGDPALAQIPIVMISSIDSSQYADQLPDDVQIPIDAWISKPVNPDHLLKTIRRFLAAPQPAGATYRTRSI